MNDAITNINSIGFTFTIVMGIMLLFLPRRIAVLPLIATACYLTLGQVLGVGPLHFSVMRIMIFIGWLRILIYREHSGFMFKTIDKAILAYAFTSAIAYILLRKDSGALINSLGFLYNTIGLYFLFRAIVRDERQYHAIFKILAIIMLPLAVSMVFEKVTGRNIFSIFGGVPEYTMVRNGKLRCQGAFSHPILAGTFGATSIPFFISLWVDGVEKRLAMVGLMAATAITITSASSGPLMVYSAVVVGTFMWRFRERMRMIRWLLLLILIGLHIIMKAPVWALIGKVSELIGGGGWHRVMVIDAAIDHFNEWWFLGTDYTRHWLPTGVSWSDKHTDITNNFVGVGIKGGFFSLMLFISILVYCFKDIGKRLKEIEYGEANFKFTIWCLGVSLFSHITAFFSISYFDQIIVFWYLLLAMVGGLSIGKARLEGAQCIGGFKAQCHMKISQSW